MKPIIHKSQYLGWLVIFRGHFRQCSSWDSALNVALNIDKEFEL